jgi:hypothetical protein
MHQLLPLPMNSLKNPSKLLSVHVMVLLCLCWVFLKAFGLIGYTALATALTAPPYQLPIETAATKAAATTVISVANGPATIPTEHKTVIIATAPSPVLTQPAVAAATAPVMVATPSPSLPSPIWTALQVLPPRFMAW